MDELEMTYIRTVRTLDAFRETFQEQRMIEMDDAK